LAFHNAQLEASAFREEYDPDTFEDMTLPKIDMIHKVRTAFFPVLFKSGFLMRTRQRAGKLMEEWKDLVRKDPTANVVVVTTGSKRKPASVAYYYSFPARMLMLCLQDVNVEEAEIRSKYDSGTLAKVRSLLLCIFWKLNEKYCILATCGSTQGESLR
jgi:ATP-dependent DNA helicase 2 subunit 1